MNVLKALAHRPFALLWTGQTVSRLGDSLYQVALTWWIVEKSGSASAASIAAICAFVPTILFLLVGGVVVDRLPRVRVMLVADVIRCGLAAWVGWLSATHTFALWHVFAVSALFGFVNAFFAPAYAALMPQVVPMRLLPGANALTTLGAEISGAAGPALAAIIVGFGGTAWAFYLDAASFLLSAACLLPLARRVYENTEPRKSNLLQDAHEGFSVVRRSTWLWFTILLLVLLNLTGRSPISIALPFLVKDQVGAGVVSLGALYSLFSLGSIMGAAAMGQLGPTKRRGFIFYAGLCVVGLVTAALGATHSIVVLGGLMCALGTVLSFSNLIWATLLQEKVPGDMLGCVSSISMLGSTSLLPVGFALVGRATDVLGAAAVFAVCGALTLAVAATGLTLPAIRRLD